LKGAFEPRPGREVFNVPLSIDAADIDLNGHVNNVVYVRWLQEAGTAHWRAHFPDDLGGRWSWVVLRHEIDYRRALRAGDMVSARTWVGEPRGVRFDRYVLIEGPDGVAAQGHTEWALVEAATQRPHRIPAEILAAFLPAA
jgi:acyl-CoA thioester hydrolase